MRKTPLLLVSTALPAAQSHGVPRQSRSSPLDVGVGDRGKGRGSPVKERIHVQIHRHLFDQKSTVGARHDTGQ